MVCTIEIQNGLLGVMDEDGMVHDVVDLTSYRDAKRQISKWAHEFTFDVADAYRQLAEHFAAQGGTRRLIIQLAKASPMEDPEYTRFHCPHCNREAVGEVTGFSDNKPSRVQCPVCRRNVWILPTNESKP